MSSADGGSVASGGPSDGGTGGTGAAWRLPPPPPPPPPAQAPPLHGGEKSKAPKKLDEAMNVLTSMLADLEHELRDHSAHVAQLDGAHAKVSPLPPRSPRRRSATSGATERRMSGGGKDVGSDIASLSSASTSTKKTGSLGSKLGSHGDKLDSALGVLTAQLAGLEKELRDHKHPAKKVNIDKFASVGPGPHQGFSPGPSVASELDAMTQGIMRLRSSLAFSSSDDKTEGMALRPEAVNAIPSQQPDGKKNVSPRMERPTEAWIARSVQQPDVARQPMPVRVEGHAEEKERSRTLSPCPDRQFSSGQAQYSSASQQAALASPLFPRRELLSEAQQVGIMQSPVVSRTLSPPRRDLPHEALHFDPLQQQDLARLQSPTHNDLPPEAYHNFAAQQPELARAPSAHRRELPPQAYHGIPQHPELARASSSPRRELPSEAYNYIPQQSELARASSPPRRERQPDAYHHMNPQQPELARAQSPFRRQRLPEGYQHTTPQQPELTEALSTPRRELPLEACRHACPQQQEFSRAPSPPCRDPPFQGYHHTTPRQAALAYDRTTKQEPELPGAFITPRSELPPEALLRMTAQQPELVRVPSPPRREQLPDAYHHTTPQHPELARTLSPPRRELPPEGYHHMNPQQPEQVRSQSPSHRELPRDGYYHMNPQQPELVRALSPSCRELSPEGYHHMNPEQSELVRSPSPSCRELPPEGYHHMNSQQPELVRAASPSRRELPPEGYHHINSQQSEQVSSPGPSRRELPPEAYRHMKPQQPELVRAASPSRRELPPEANHHTALQQPELARSRSPPRRELPPEVYHHIAPQQPELARAPFPSRRELPPEADHHTAQQQAELAVAPSPSRREVPPEAYHHITPQQPELARAPSPPRRELLPEAHDHFDPQQSELARAPSSPCRELPPEAYHHAAPQQPELARIPPSPRRELPPEDYLCMTPRQPQLARASPSPRRELPPEAYHFSNPQQPELARAPSPPRRALPPEAYHYTALPQPDLARAPPSPRTPVPPEAPSPRMQQSDQYVMGSPPQQVRMLEEASTMQPLGSALLVEGHIENISPRAVQEPHASPQKSPKQCEPMLEVQARGIPVPQQSEQFLPASLVQDDRSLEVRSSRSSRQSGSSRTEAPLRLEWAGEVYTGSQQASPCMFPSSEEIRVLSARSQGSSMHEAVHPAGTREIRAFVGPGPREESRNSSARDIGRGMVDESANSHYHGGLVAVESLETQLLHPIPSESCFAAPEMATATQGTHSPHFGPQKFHSGLPGQPSPSPMQPAHVDACAGMPYRHGTHPIAASGMATQGDFPNAPETPHRHQQSVAPSEYLPSSSAWSSSRDGYPTSGRTTTTEGEPSLHAALCHTPRGSPCHMMRQVSSAEPYRMDIRSMPTQECEMPQSNWLLLESPRCRPRASQMREDVATGPCTYPQEVSELGAGAKGAHVPASSHTLSSASAGSSLVAAVGLQRSKEAHDIAEEIRQECTRHDNQTGVPRLDVHGARFHHETPRDLGGTSDFVAGRWVDGDSRCSPQPCSPIPTRRAMNPSTLGQDTPSKPIPVPRLDLRPPDPLARGHPPPMSPHACTTPTPVNESQHSVSTNDQAPLKPAMSFSAGQSIHDSQAIRPRMLGGLPKSESFAGTENISRIGLRHASLMQSETNQWMAAELGASTQTLQQSRSGFHTPAPPESFPLAQRPMLPAATLASTQPTRNSSAHNLSAHKLPAHSLSSSAQYVIQGSQQRCKSPITPRTQDCRAIHPRHASIQVFSDKVGERFPAHSNDAAAPWWCSTEPVPQRGLSPQRQRPASPAAQRPVSPRAQRSMSSFSTKHAGRAYSPNPARENCCTLAQSQSRTGFGQLPAPPTATSTGSATAPMSRTPAVPIPPASVPPTPLTRSAVFCHASSTASVDLSTSKESWTSLPVPSGSQTSTTPMRRSQMVSTAPVGNQSLCAAAWGAQATPQATASAGQSQQVQCGLQGQPNPFFIHAPPAQPAPISQSAPPAPSAHPPHTAVAGSPVGPQLQPGLQVQPTPALQTTRLAPPTQGVPTPVFPHQQTFQLQMNPLIGNQPGMAPGATAPAPQKPMLPSFHMHMPGFHSRNSNISRASSGHSMQHEWANVPLGLQGRAHSTSSCASSFDYSKFVPQWVPPGSSLGPASMYVADPTDRIDAVFSRSLLNLGQDQASRLMLRRKGRGKYEIDGRQVTVSWQAEGASHELVVREDDIAEGLPVPLDTYLAQASNVAIALAGRAGSPAVARIPKEKRLTFREAATDPATAAIDNLGNERSESMKIAVEQARIREQAAAAYEHTMRHNAAMAPGGMPIPSLVSL